MTTPVLSLVYHHTHSLQPITQNERPAFRNLHRPRGKTHIITRVLAAEPKYNFCTGTSALSPAFTLPYSRLGYFAIATTAAAALDSQKKGGDGSRGEEACVHILSGTAAMSPH